MNKKYQQIWLTVQAIPKGKVACYGQIADLAGLPGRARLVGKALGFVPADGVNQQSVPWYRVINSQGRISFPIGSLQFEQQKACLQEENVIVLGNKISLREFQWQPELHELLHLLRF